METSGGIDWMQIIWAGFMIMMLVVMWPAYKWWSKNAPKAGEGDWQAAILPLLAVVAFVVLLVMMV